MGVRSCLRDVLQLDFEGIAEVPEGLNLSEHALAVLGHIRLHLFVPLLDELDVLDLGLEGADLQLLGLNLTLVALKPL